jgi:hypothetical protein
MNLNPAQAEYIDNLKRDYPETTEPVLRKTLTDAGWPDFEVTEALNRFGFSSVAEIPVSTSIQPEVSVTSSEEVAAQKAQPTTEEAPVRKSHTTALLVGIFGFVAVAGLVAGAYYMYPQFFRSGAPTLTDETLLPTLFTKLSEIEKTNYEVSFSLDVVPREEGLLSFAEMFPRSEAELQMYQRDVDRVRDIAKILESLRTAVGQGTNSWDVEPVQVLGQPLLYPQSLSAVGLTLQDPSGKPYQYERLDQGQSFALTVTFETAEAYNSVYYYQSGGEVGELTAVFGPFDYVYQGSLSEQPTGPKLFGVLALDDVEAYLPTDLKAYFALGGSVDNAEDKSADARLTAEGSVSFGDANFSASVEGIKKS